jgi:hypothetical protein
MYEPRLLGDCVAQGFSGALLHWAMPVAEGDSGPMLRSGPRSVPAVPSSAFAGFRFPPEIIVFAVRWYLRYGLSYRDVEELVAERGIEVDHVTVYRVGAALHAAARRCGPPVPARGRRSLMCRRDIREGRWPVALRLSGRRPVRPDHRRVCFNAARYPSRAAVLHDGAGESWRADRGRHRSSVDAPRCRR